MFKSFTSLQRLRILDLASNGLGPDGCRAAASAAAGLPNLTSLEMRNNGADERTRRTMRALLTSVGHLSLAGCMADCGFDSEED